MSPKEIGIIIKKKYFPKVSVQTLAEASLTLDSRWKLMSFAVENDRTIKSYQRDILYIRDGYPLSSNFLVIGEVVSYDKLR